MSTSSEKSSHHHSAASPKKEEGVQPVYHDVRTLLEWEAPNRPFKLHSREYYVNALLIMLALEVILFLFSQFLLMLVVLALVFVVFALITIPPHPATYRISSEGVSVDEHFYLWQELYDFFFIHRFGEEMFVIRTEDFFPGELTMMLGSTSKEHVKQLLLYYLPYREHVRKTFMEKSGDWLAKTFPLEKTHA